MPQEPLEPRPGEEGHPEWFREPTRREHAMGAGLFIAFGIFFVLLFILQRNWWFRWVILAIGAASLWRGLRHVIGAIGPPDSDH